MADFIKEGGYCRSRDGLKYGPMSYNAAGFPFFWRATRASFPGDVKHTWTADGRYTISGAASERDLVAEWVDEPAPQQEPVAEPDYKRIANMWQAYLHGRDIYPKDVKAMLKIAEIMEDGNGPQV